MIVLASAGTIKISHPIAITQESTLGYIRDSYEPLVEESRHLLPPYQFAAPDFHQGFKPFQPAPQYHTIPNMAYHGELPINPEIYPSTSLQVPQKDSFDFFSSSYLRPADTDYPEKLDSEMIEMQKLQPPPLPELSDIDYYAVKPRKTNPKKYVPGKMHIYIKKQKSGFKETAKVNDKDVVNIPIRNDQYFQDPIFKVNEPTEYNDEIKAPADDGEDQHDDGDAQPETAETKVEDDENQDDGDSSKDASSQSPAIPESKKQISFQVHGFDGPKSYKFGYDTGKGCVVTKHLILHLHMH